MKRDLNIRIHFILCLLLAFFMPLLPVALPVLIALLVLNRLLYFKYNEVSRTRTELTALIVFAGLYIAYMAGMLYTSDTSTGWRDLETKLSLLLLPLLFFFSWKADEIQTRTILRAFVWGCAASMVYSFGSSVYVYYDTLRQVELKVPGIWDFGINTFLSSRLTKHFHPSYLSMYVNLAIAAVFYINGWPKQQLSKLQYLLVAFLVIYVLFINAKSGLLFLVLLGLIYMYFLVFRMKKIKEALITLGIFAVLAGVLWVAAPEFARKIKAAVAAAVESNVDKSSEESSMVRRAIWKASAEVIAEHVPLGTGTGDSKNVLIDKYKAVDLVAAYTEKLNCHNQYLQTGVSIGIAGMLFLAGSLLLPLIYSLRRKRYLQLIFILLIVINFLSESMLETQAGVIFFAFFNSYFMFNSLKGNEA